MRTLWVLGTAALVAGCATWRAEAPADLRSSAFEGRFFVVTKDQALQLEEARVDESEIVGKTVARWTFPALKAESLEYLQNTNNSPKDIANELSWEPADRTGETARVPFADVAVLRKYEPRSGLTAIAIFGGFIGTIALALGIAALVVLPHLSCGRPLRVRGRWVITSVAPAAEPAGWTEALALAPVPEAARRVLADVWTVEARAEHAAVAAFSKLALELMALGAPPDLVARANRAAIQEVEHARLCFAVASAYAGRALEPAPLPEALAGDTPDLSRL
ncbi:MAG TPA: hypothetical protein VG454_15725, partial [Gemmatimonadales bacterium]|nr:hypothetical protein [Gemmatimonadales bacterium]